MTTPNADNARNVVKYLGQNYIFTPSYVRTRDPTTSDIKDPKNQGYYPYTALWINKSLSTVNNQTDNLWALVKIANNLATWILLSGGGVGPLLKIGVPLGTSPILPDTTGLINFTSTGGTVQITGSAGGLGLQNINFDITGGAVAIEKIAVDASTPPGTNPVVPSGGIITVTGAQVAASAVGTNVIRTDSLAANTYTIEIQRSQAVAVSTLADNGVSHFNSADFTVDANGFVSGNGHTVKWNIISASQTLVKNNGYICVSPGGSLSLDLPTTASSTLGDLLEVTLDGSTSWTITQAAGQQIRFSGSQTTLGATGSLGTTGQGDTIKMVYQATGKWNVISACGNLTVT